MKAKLKRSMAILLSFSMLLSGSGSVLAEEQGTEAGFTGQETETMTDEYGLMPPEGGTNDQEEMGSVAAVEHTVTLPYFSACMYGYDDMRLRETEPKAEKELDENGRSKEDIVLLYYPDETVNINIWQQEGWEIQKVSVLDEQNREIGYFWKNQDTIEFLMPETDVWLDVSFVARDAMEPTVPPAADIPADQGQTEWTEAVANQGESGWTEPTMQMETTALQDREDSTPEPSDPGNTEDQTPAETLPPESEAPTEHPGQEETPETSAAETETDGLPAQGSIEQVPGIVIPFDTWDFDQYEDFRNINYDTELFEIDYLSDDIIYDEAGTYSSIYRVTERATGKFWFVLRPVTVLPESQPQEATETETESRQQEATETEPESQPQEATETEPESQQQEATETETESQPQETTETEPESQQQEAIETESELLTEALYEEESELAEPFVLDQTPVLFAEGEGVDEDPVPDKFKLLIGGRYEAPSSLRSGDAATTYKTVVFTEDDGTKTTRMAYCIQPKLNSPNSGTTYGKDKADEIADSNGMAKGLYYLYGGPAWNKTVTLTDGSTVNLHDVMKKAGCSSNGHYYTISHYVLSYIYMKGNNWNWNSGESNVLNSAGVSLVKRVVNYLDKMQEPGTRLSESSLTAEAIAASESRVSGSVTYQAIEDNTAQMSLQAGLTLVNETSGATVTGPAVATLNGGDTFHFVVADDVADQEMHLDLNCKYAVDFTAFRLKMSGYQDIGFSYYSGDKVLGLVLHILDMPVLKGSLFLQKVDATTQTTVPLNGNYSLAGAEYTVYADQGLTVPVATLVTGADGRSQTVELDPGQYYIKETKASLGYRLDPQVYPVTVVSDETVSVTSYEEAIQKQISLQKYDKETGKTEPYHPGVSFAGAQYTIYSDPACTAAVETLTTDANGYAQSGSLAVATYYVKETKRPDGYQIDPTVYTVNMAVSDNIETYGVDSYEQVVKKPVEIQKYDKQTGQYRPTGSSASFADAEYTVYSDAACTQAVETVVTDENGYAKTSELVMGTYYIKETKAPAGYLIDETVHQVTVADDANTIYRVESQEQIISGSLMVMKYLDDHYDDSILQDWTESGILAGIKFILTYEDASVAPVEITTDRYGYAATAEGALLYGTWILREDPETTPEGYAGLERAEIKVTEHGMQLRYIVTNALQDASARIVKKDALTGNLIPVAGVKFQILDRTGTPVMMPDNLDYSKMTDTFRTNDEGIIFLTKKLRLGTYTLKEVEAPAGYLLQDAFTFEVTGKSSYEDPLVIECPDQPQMGRIRIEKKDAGTKETLGEGFAFEIRTAEDIQDPAGTVRKLTTDDGEVELTAGTLVATLTTGADGTCESPELYLGSYIVTECAAGEHYALGTEVYPVELLPDASVVTVQADLEVENEKTAVEILKVDSESTEEQEIPLEGIAFRIFTAKELEAAGGEAGRLEQEDLMQLGTEYLTDEKGRIRIEDLLHDTVYYVFESSTLPGYNLEDSLYKLTVDENGLIDGKAVYRLMVSNVANLVEITKKDITGGKELPGATLTVRNEAGEVIDTWVSTEEPHRIKGLAAGTYTLTEEQPPEGYGLAETITFVLRDSFEVQQVEMFDEQLQVLISKKTVTGGEELPGAVLTITDEEGNLIEKWTSGTEPHAVKLGVGKYVLTEIAAPDKYAKAESIEFEVKEDLSVRSVEMLDAPIQVAISKKDITTKEEIEGAQLTVMDQEGNVVADWTSTKEPHMLNLAVGTYTLTEVAAPKNYSKAESITFTVTDTAEIQTVEMFDEPIQVEISKVDITDGKELPGAKLTVSDADGNVVEEWVSTEEPHRMTLPVGKYTLTEVAAPDKYATAETISFEVTDTMELQKVKMEDAPIRVAVSKLDITDGKELPGAKLTVKNAAGETVETWVSTNEPHMMNLPVGTYTLTEVMAPEGYEVAETITFEVKDTMEIQPVKMYDKPKDSTVDLTGKKDEKTKTTGGGGQPSIGGQNPGVTALPVKTGDYNRYVPALFLIVLGSVMLGAVWMYRKKKRK